jgi:hypothetical protein
MLTKNDYIKILEYYHLPIPQSMRLLKKKAENVLSLKLCKCIKKVAPNNEPKAIGICTRTVFNRKGLQRKSFKCTNGRFVNIDKLKRKNKTKKNRK